MPGCLTPTSAPINCQLIGFDNVTVAIYKYSTTRIVADIEEESLYF